MPESGRTTEPCNRLHGKNISLACRILFHPDCHRRFRNRTGSADPFAVKRRSRTSRYRVIAGGDLHPALRIQSNIRLSLCRVKKWMRSIPQIFFLSSSACGRSRAGMTKPRLQRDKVVFFRIDCLYRAYPVLVTYREYVLASTAENNIFCDVHRRQA
jgi:hypothetical protein